MCFKVTSEEMGEFDSGDQFVDASKLILRWPGKGGGGTLTTGCKKCYGLGPMRLQGSSNTIFDIGTQLIRRD